MPIHSITQNGEFPIIQIGGIGGKTIDTSTIKIVGGRQQQGKNDRMKLGLQFIFDVLTPLVDLPIEDSYKTTDPATNREFWDAGGVNLVTRMVEVTDVNFDGTKYILSLSRVKE